MMDLKLSEAQQRAIGTALTLLAVGFIVAVFGFLAWWIGRFLVYFSNVFMPLAVAGIVALVMKPYYDWVHAHTGRNAIIAVALVYLSLIIPMLGFSWFFGALIVEQVTGLSTNATALVREGWALLKGHWPDIVEQARLYGVETEIRELLEERMDLISGGILAAMRYLYEAGADLFRTIAGLFSWVIFPIYLGFFLATPQLRQAQVEGMLPFLKEETRADVIYLGTEFVNMIVSFFRGQLIIALLQGLLYAIGFSIIGLQYGFVLGLLLGLLNIVPYLGSIVGLAITIPLGFLQPDGGWTLALAVVIAFTVVQLIESYLLTPRIMGSRTGLHPLVIIIAIFFWGTAFGGIWGMILAIPLTAFLVVCWRLLKEKYIQEVV